MSKMQKWGTRAEAFWMTLTDDKTKAYPYEFSSKV